MCEREQKVGSFSLRVRLDGGNKGKEEVEEGKMRKSNCTEKTDW